MCVYYCLRPLRLLCVQRRAIQRFSSLTCRCSPRRVLHICCWRLGSACTAAGPASPLLGVPCWIVCWVSVLKYQLLGFIGLAYLYLQCHAEGVPVQPADCLARDRDTSCRAHARMSILPTAWFRVCGWHNNSSYVGGGHRLQSLGFGTSWPVQLACAGCPVCSVL